MQSILRWIALSQLTAHISSVYLPWPQLPGCAHQWTVTACVTVAFSFSDFHLSFLFLHPFRNFLAPSSPSLSLWADNMTRLAAGSCPRLNQGSFHKGSLPYRWGRLYSLYSLFPLVPAPESLTTEPGVGFDKLGWKGWLETGW